MSQPTPYCDCKDCQELEHPCEGDCEPGEHECQGCREARQEAEDIRFEIDKETGRI